MLAVPLCREPIMCDIECQGTGLVVSVCSDEGTYWQARCSRVCPSLFVQCTLQCWSVIRCFTTSKWPFLHDSEMWYLTAPHGKQISLLQPDSETRHECMKMVTELVKMDSGCDGFTTSKWPSLHDSERWYLTVSYGIQNSLLQPDSESKHAQRWWLN